jgi:hypothetical protein
MDKQDLRSVIRAKLVDGRLPVDSIPRIWGGPAEAETCDACETLIAGDQMVIEGISLAGGRKPLQLHTLGFSIWDEERRTC